MRVLYSSIYKPAPTDGVSNTSHHLVGELRARGIQVLLSTTDCGMGLSAYRDFADEDLHVFRRTFAKPIEVSLPMIRQLAGLVRQVDVCHFNGFFSVASVVGSLFARRQGTPYVIGPVGNCVPGLRECLRRPADLGKRVFFHALAKAALENARFIVCSSDKERQWVSPLVRSHRVVVIPNGVDIQNHARPSGVAPFAAPYVLFLGRISREKSLLFLLEVWADVRKLAPEALLVIAGNDDFCPGYTDVVTEKARQLSLLDSVRLTGAVSGDLKTALLAASACLVLPSVRESFGHVVVEALGVGTPVVTSTGTPWRAMAEAGLGDWIPLEKDLWVTRIHDYLKRAGCARDDFARKCRSWRKTNLQTWSQVAAMHHEVYHRAIERRARPPVPSL
jgi:glycosyltransferase involved in cell wall biosynthesis